MLISQIKENLLHAKAIERLSHAYIIVGNPRGAAMELAEYIMGLLACNGENAPCGTCDTCHQIANHTWADAYFLAPAKKSRVISVQQMRRGPPESQNPFDPPYFIPWLSDSSFLGGWKVGIIQSADRMNTNAANALLKILEEPPSQTMLLLLTDTPQQLLPTIRSRCSLVEITEPPPELEPEYFDPLMELLSGCVEKGALASVAKATRITSILEEMHSAVEKEIKAEIKDEEEGGVEVDGEQEEALIAAAYREKRQLLIMTMQRWYRDLLVIRSGGDESIVHYKEFIEPLKRAASQLTLAQALASVDAMEELTRQLARNLTEQLVFSYWLDRLA